MPLPPPIDLVHPAALDPCALATACEFRTTRRSGPGGQNRNKVETAVILTHRPTGISAEAAERRTQGENRRLALFRLRLELALRVRRPLPPHLLDPTPASAPRSISTSTSTPSSACNSSSDSASTPTSASASSSDSTPCSTSTPSSASTSAASSVAASDRWRSRCKGGRISVNPEHDDFPALLAEALDLLASFGQDPKPAAAALGCSPSQLLRFLKLEPRAFALLNRQRRQSGLHPFG